MDYLAPITHVAFAVLSLAVYESRRETLKEAQPSYVSCADGGFAFSEDCPQELALLTLMSLSIFFACSRIYHIRVARRTSSAVNSVTANTPPPSPSNMCAPKPLPAIQLLQATYGTASKSLNVTSIVKGWVKGGNYLHISKQLDLNSTFGDPHRFHRKKLRLVALVKGEPLVDVVKETRGEDFIIDMRPKDGDVTRATEGDAGQSEKKMHWTKHKLVTRTASEFGGLSQDKFAEFEVERFLSACTTVADMIELFGTSFLPVRANITDNAAKIRKQIDVRNKKADSPLEGDALRIKNLIQYEIDENIHRVDGSVTISTLWLKRALDFMVVFFTEMSNDDMKSLVAAKAAFSKTLAPWQGWMLQTTCNAALRMVPERGKVMEILSPTWSMRNNDAAADINYAMKETICTMMDAGVSSVVNDMDTWFTENGLDFDDKV